MVAHRLHAAQISIYAQFSEFSGRLVKTITQFNYSHWRSATTLLCISRGATMITVAGIFADRDEAVSAVRDLRAIGIAYPNVDLLVPGTAGEHPSTVPSADTE